MDCPKCGGKQVTTGYGFGAGVYGSYTCCDNPHCLAVLELQPCASMFTTDIEQAEAKKTAEAKLRRTWGDKWAPHFKGFLSVCLAILLVGCSSPPKRPPTATEARCEYEAERATVGLGRGFARSEEKYDLYRKCARLSSMVEEESFQREALRKYREQNLGAR